MKNTDDNAPKINELTAGNGIVAPLFTDDDTFSAPQLLTDNCWGKKVYFFLQKAKQEILIATFKFEINLKPRGRYLKKNVDELIIAKKRGVNIKLLLNIHSDFRSTSPGNLYAARYLSQYGFEIKHLPRGRTCHLKLLLIDKTFLIIGSHNWAIRSLTSNAEASILTRDRNLILQTRNYFLYLWKQAAAIRNHKKSN